MKKTIMTAIITYAAACMITSCATHVNHAHNVNDMTQLPDSSYNNPQQQSQNAAAIAATAIRPLQ